MSGLDVIFKQEGIDCSKKLIGVNVRKWGQLSKIAVSKLPSVLNYFIGKGYQIIFLCSPSDVKITKKIMEKTINKDNCKILVATNYRPSLILGLISKFKIIITMRLHFVISAAVVNTPCAVIPYLPKVENYAKKFSMPLIDIKELNSSQISHMLEKNINRNNANKVLKISSQYEDNILKALKIIISLKNKFISLTQRIKALIPFCFLVAEIFWYTLPLNKKKASQKYIQ